MWYVVVQCCDVCDTPVTPHRPVRLTGSFNWTVAEVPSVLTAFYLPTVINYWLTARGVP